MEKNIHEDCGVAMIRLLKPLEYYQEKYGTWMYALNKLYLMMEKQHNRGQEGAGMASVKLDSEPGNEYMFRERAEGKNAVAEIFANVHKHYKDYSQEQLSDVSFAKTNLPFAGDLYMGHLRYSTTGKSGLSYVHPFLRRNNWKAKNLCMCGNFNMTNIEDIFEKLTDQGQCPRIYSDTYLLLELMGHRLDREVERNFVKAQELGLTKRDITEYIEDNIQISNVLKTTMEHFDGGYVICGQTGSGEMFSIRDPWAIRPAFYYKNDEIVVVASERPVLQTTFDLECEDIQELKPGQALIVNKRGEASLQQILEPKTYSACSFERIYFSRGSDQEIYLERKKLGALLLPQVLHSIDNDLKNTVFSYIPNTAETSFYGLIEAVSEHLNQKKKQQILQEGTTLTEARLSEILSVRPRIEKVAIKDVKLRTFITEDSGREDMVAHVYDITYGSVKKHQDNLVIIDDSIVRGTTLKKSILNILNRLQPKKITVLSSAPQIRYPDCYGIDMARLEDLIAFEATLALHKDAGTYGVVEAIYQKCIAQKGKPDAEIINYVKELYAPFTPEQISQKITQLLRPEAMKCDLDIIFQSVENLHKACPKNLGDWYFTGDYPTVGGNRVVNQAFINFYEGNKQRAY